MAYATRRDLEDFGLPKQALSGLSARVLQRHLDAASGRVDSYLRGQYTLPLASPYPMEIVECTVILASYSLLLFRGFNPDEYDANYRERYIDMVGQGESPGWLDRLSKGVVNLATTADATPNVNEGRPEFSTGPSRGWDEPAVNGRAEVS